MIPAYGQYPPGWPEKAKKLKFDRGHRCERCCWGGDLAPDSSVGVYNLDRNRANDAAWNLAVLCPACRGYMKELDLKAMLYIYSSPGVFGDNEAWLKSHIDGIIAEVDKTTKKVRRLAGKLKSPKTPPNRR